MSNRFLKQLIYGSFFIIIFLAFGYGFFLFISPTSSCFDGKKNGLEENVDCGGSCQSCEIKALSKLEVIKAMLIPAKEGSSVLVFQIKNPNPFYGASSFFYKVYNETGEFSFLLSSGESFIYSGETKYVIEPLLSLNAESVKNIVVSLDNISWSRRDAFNSPDLNIRETSTKLENDSISVSGIISNRDTFNFSKIPVEVLFFDAANNLIGASKTEIKDLKSFTERQFIITYPSIPADPGKTKIFFDAKKAVF